MSADPLAGLRPDHAGICVADLKGSIAWYGEMLGFTVDRVVDIPEDTGRLALIRKGDFLLELFCLPESAPLPEERRHPSTDLRTQGMKHVAYAVSDLRALMAHLKAKDVDVVWDIVEHDGTRCAFVRDNSGNIVEFLER
jgi:catechol 2,3-dioxygenase-like lactoylglutathione lyase family enzyme